MSNGQTPFIAIWMVTYNHGQFIAQAIESVLSQKTSYPYRLYIGEDCSPDNTRAICQDYASRYPDRITLICTEKNNIDQNSSNIYNAAFNSGAKYIAMLEGDDYWIDNYKLQKQVDFLEQHADYSMCFSNARVLNSMGMQTINAPVYKEYYTVEDIVQGDAFIYIPTLLYRNILGFPLPSVYNKTRCGDIAIELLLADTGKGKFFNEDMAVYRQHASSLSRSEAFLSKLERAKFDLFDNFNEYTHHKYHAVIKEKLFPMSKTLLMHGSGLLKGKERKAHISRMLKGYFKYSSGLNIKEISYYILVLFFPFVLNGRKSRQKVSSEI